MSNYSKFSVGNDGRTELHDKLNYSFPNPIDYTTKDHITSFG